MFEFRYRRPTSVSEAERMLAEDEDARPLAGGMSILPTMKHRLAAVSALIDLDRLPELKGIEAHDGTIRIASMSRHAEVQHSAAVLASIPALADVEAEIVDRVVR